MTEHFGYKKIQNGFIVKLRIEDQNNEQRTDIKPENAHFAKYRCERAFVLDIYHSLDKSNRIDKGYGLYDPTFLYTVGEYVSIEDYDQDLELICSNGIHYFLSEENAYFWKFDISNYTGIWKYWHPNGQLERQIFYKNGQKDGEEKQWYPNGKLDMLVFYKNGQKYGEAKNWHANGQLSIQKFYKDGQKNGIVKGWHENGQLSWQAFYKNDKIDGEEKQWHENGQLSWQAFYKDGHKDGIVKEWFENGLLRHEKYYFKL